MSTCLTPGAVYHISISPHWAAVAVDVPAGLDLDETGAAILERDLHSAVERDLHSAVERARHFPDSVASQS